MSIASAINALAPWWYFKLDEASGTVIHDSSGHGIDMSFTGTSGENAIGPELGTHAFRFFSDCIMHSPALGLTAWSSFSLMWFATSNSLGGVPQSQVFGINDINNKNTRGLGIFQTSAGPDNLTWQVYGTSINQSAQAPYPKPLWHAYAWTYQPSPQVISFYADGTLVASVTSQAPGTVWQSTDVLWIQSAYPTLLAHLAAFTSTLTQTQIQTVTSQIHAWPYTDPINVPVVGGTTTVDLTPVLADTSAILANQATADPLIATTKTNTDTLLTDWGNYTGVTLPSLNDVLSNILAGFNVTLSTAGGAISSTLGELFSMKTLDQLTLVHVAGPSCDPIHATSGILPNWCYGLIVRCTTIPDWYARSTPDDAYYEPELGVLNLTRGEDGVASHTLRYERTQIYPLPWMAVPWESGILNLPIVPPDLSCDVYWNTGVCGELYALMLP